MVADSKEDILRSTTVEDMYGDYKNGITTREQLNKAVREKALLGPKDFLAEKGYMGAIYSKTIEHIQNSWDEFIKGFSTGGHKFAAYDDTMGRFLWMNFKIGSAPFTALGEVNRAAAERSALNAGASPGLARGIGISAEIGTNFLPVRALARGLSKGVGLKVGEQTTEAAIITQKESEAAKQVIDKVVEESLAADGLAIETIAATGTEGPKTLIKAIDPLNRGKRVKLNAPLPSEITSGLDILKAQIPKFSINPTKEEFETLRKLARGALKDGTQDAETSFAKYMAAMFSPQTSGKINISKQMMGLLTEWAPEKMAQGDLRGAMKILAEDISALSVKQLSGGANLNLVRQARQNQGFFPGMREVFTNALLPLSASAAFIGNSIAASMAVAERFSISPTQAWYLTKGMTLGVGDGLTAFGRAFRAVPNPATGRFSFPVTGPVPGRLGRIIRKPTETVVGMDNFFTEMFTRGSYYASAAREGMNQGLRGGALGSFIRQSVQNPTGQMRLDAEAFSQTNTFQNQLGPLAGEIQSIIHTNIPGIDLRPGQYYFPFMKSAINLIKYSWDRTPGLQLASHKLWSDMIAGGARGDDAAARLIMGNMLGMYFHELAKEGVIIGSGPVDPRLREAWLAQNKPHTVKLSDGSFLDNKLFEPLNHVMDIVADLTMVVDQHDDLTIQQGFHAAVFAIIGSYGNNSWWGQASQMTTIIQGDLGYDQSMKVIMSPLTGTIPGPIGRRVTQAIDPATRDARTWVDQLWANTPGFSKTIPKLRDAYGDPLIPFKPVLNSWFGLLGQAWPKTADFENDRVKSVGAKLGVKIPKFPNTIGAGPIESPADITTHEPGSVQPMSRLTNDQKDQWQEETRKFIRDPKYGMEKMVLDNPIINFDKLSVAGQRAMFQGAMSDYRGAGKDMLIANDKELGKKIFTNQAQAEIMQLPSVQQPAARAALDYGLSIYDKLSSEELKNIMKWGDLTPDEEAPAEPLQLNVAPTR